MSDKNDFTKGSIPRNILSIALPMTAAQLINILYNVVDRMYLGRMPVDGRLALTGLGLTLPIISILIGFANLCGVGGAPLCSICRGQGDKEEAQRIMGNSFALLLLFGVVLTALGLLFKEPMLYLFGASGVTFPYADGYLTIYLLGTVFVMIGLGMNPFINAQGFGKTGMLTVALGAVVNLVLDPIFIYVLHMGVKGAALATVISQACSAIWVLHFLTGKKTILRLKFSDFRLERRRVWNIITLGMSGFIMALTNSLTQVVCNATLQAYGGDLYVGVMTVINSVREVFSLPISGISQGAQPILSYNYGAKEYDRVKAGIRFMSAVVVVGGLVIWGATMLTPGLFIRIFNNESALIEAGIPAIRLYFSTFFCMSFMFSGQAVFVVLGRAKNAIFFSLLRKAAIVAPLTLLLPRLWGLGVQGVFLAEPISNLLGGGACFITMLVTVYFPLKRLGKEGNTLPHG